MIISTAHVEKFTIPDGLELVVSSNNGQYIPQHAANMITSESHWTGYDLEDIAILKEGPDHEHYWEAWHSVLNSAKWVNYGLEWTMHDDDGLWMVCPEIMTDDEYFDTFGEER